MQSNVAASSNAYRNVWFSDNTNDLKRVHDADFQYNPGTNDLKVGTVNGKTVKEITSKNYNVSFDAWAAGTIGTRAAQKIINIASDAASYGNVIGVSIVYIGDSSTAHYQAFLYADQNQIYVNAYRANASAVGAQSSACTVRVTYAK